MSTANRNSKNLNEHGLALNVFWIPRSRDWVQFEVGNDFEQTSSNQVAATR